MKEDFSNIFCFFLKSSDTLKFDFPMICPCISSYWLLIIRRLTNSSSFFQFSTSFSVFLVFAISSNFLLISVAYFSISLIKSASFFLRISTLILLDRYSFTNLALSDKNSLLACPSPVIFKSSGKLDPFPVM